MRTAMVAACLVAWCVTPAPVGAQEDERSEQRSLRHELERRLQRLRDQQSKYEKALSALDDGATETRVREMLGEHFERPGRRGPDELDPGGRDRPQGDRDDRRRGLSAEDTARVLAFVEQNLPFLWERLAGISPELRQRMAERFAPRFFEYERARTRDATLGALKLDELKAGLRLLDAIGAYRRALTGNPGSSDVGMTKQTLRQSLRAQFDAQQASKRREVVLLDHRVGELERELIEREAERDAILDDKLRDIESGIERGGDRRRHRGADGPG